jgi:hypothetical protein
MLFFSPVFFGGKSPLIDALDHDIIYIRMVERANWLVQGIIPLWDPKTFSGLSYIDAVPPTHLLNAQAWVMALSGNRVGYNLCIFLFVVWGAYGTYRLCQERLKIDWRLSMCAGMSVAFGPYIKNTYAGVFTLFPFLSFFLYHYVAIFHEESLSRVIRAALWALFPLTLCFYTQEPRFIEFIFSSSAAFFGIAFFVLKVERYAISRNVLIFFLIVISGFVLLTAPILFPSLLEAFHQRRLGAGEYLPAILLWPGWKGLVDIIVGSLFPINLSMFHDGVRVKLLGDQLTFYFHYIHILFYASTAIAVSIYNRLTPIERCILWMPFVTIAGVFVVSATPGLLYIWTLLFKTGRFPLESDVPFFYGVLMVFLVLDKILYSEEFKVNAKSANLARKIIYVQIVMAVAASIAIGLLRMSPQTALLAYLTEHLGKNYEKLEALYNSFLTRVPFLLVGYASIALELWIFKKLVFQHSRGNEALQNAFLVLTFVTPLFLSAGYWPFNNVPDRTNIHTPDRQFVSSLSVLDRIGSADLDTYKELNLSERKQIIPVYSPKSLEWTMRVFDPAVMEFVQHFIPQDMFDYFYRMYKDDKHFKPSYADRYYFLPNDNNLFHLLGINYVFSEVHTFADPFELIGKFGDYYVYRNAKAFPRYYFVDTITTLSNETDLLETLYTTSYEQLKTKAFILGDVPRAGSRALSCRDERRSVVLVSYMPNSITFRTRSTCKEFLVFTDTYDRRWKVFINQTEARLYKTNLLFRGVSLPPGDHTVKFLYSYPAFKNYALLSLASAIAISTWLIWPRTRSGDSTPPTA